jgi:WXG100 family type VII secretion target
MAVGTQFRTEVPTMQAASGHVAEVNGQISTELADLLQRLEPLMGAWQSSASASFDQLKTRWHDAARLNDTLGDIGERLGTAGTNYGTTDDDIRTGMDRLAGGIS